MKNLVIVLLVGYICGQLSANANAPVTSITRADLLEAAALCGLLANHTVDLHIDDQAVDATNAIKQAAKAYRR